MAVSGEMFLTDHNVLQTVIPTLAHSIDSRLVAEETIRRLELRMDPSELLDNLTVEQVENTSYRLLTLVVGLALATLVGLAKLRPQERS
jgi:capsular polysaccharide biosynthesis protein